MNYKKSLIFLFVAIFIIVALLFFIMRDENPKVKVMTTKGDFVVELYPEKAPISVNNFLRYVEDGFYDNTVFHRIIPGFMVQGGGFTVNGEQKQTKKPIKLESDNGLKNEKGTIAMARTMIPDSATSQFFVNTEDNDFLNYGVRDEGYAVFGRVIEGYEVIEEIESMQTISKYGMGDWPKEDVIIQSIEVIK